MTSLLVPVERGPLLEALLTERTDAGSLVRVNQYVLLHQRRNSKVGAADLADVGSDVEMSSVEVVLQLGFDIESLGASFKSANEILLAVYILFVQNKLSF